MHPVGDDTDRPQICFVDWGPMPDDCTVPVRVGQTGFRPANDGIAAHEISIEDFEVEPGLLFTGEQKIARIPEKGGGFALVWRQDSPWPFGNTEKWDLVGYMKAAAAKHHASSTYQANYPVKVSALYRDAFNVWYISRADLIYIPAQGRLKFGPTTHERHKAHPETTAHTAVSLEQTSRFVPRSDVALQEGVADMQGGGATTQAEFLSTPNLFQGVTHRIETDGFATQPIPTNYSLLRLSLRDQKIHGIVGEGTFDILTNAEIIKRRGFKNRLRAEGLNSADAMKACLDRIRRAKGYPLSREITKKRSSEP